MEDGFKLEQVAIRLVPEAAVWDTDPIRSPERAVEVLGKYIRDMDREAVCVVNFNARLQPINFQIVSIGTLDQALCEPREILKAAILSNANSMMILHTHPAGSITPSGSDMQMTERMEKVCDLVGIPLMDSIIIGFGREDYFSFRDASMLVNPNQKVERVAEERSGRGGR